MQYLLRYRHIQWCFRPKIIHVCTSSVQPSTAGWVSESFHRIFSTDPFLPPYSYPLFVLESSKVFGPMLLTSINLIWFSLDGAFSFTPQSPCPIDQLSNTHTRNNIKTKSTWRQAVMSSSPPAGCNSLSGCLGTVLNSSLIRHLCDRGVREAVPHRLDRPDPGPDSPPQLRFLLSFSSWRIRPQFTQWKLMVGVANGFCADHVH